MRGFKKSYPFSRYNMLLDWMDDNDLGTKDAAPVLGVAIQTLYNWQATGLVPDKIIDRIQWRGTPLLLDEMEPLTK